MSVILREWKRALRSHTVYEILMLLVLALSIFLSHAVWSDLYRVRFARQNLVNNITDKTIFYTGFVLHTEGLKRFETDDARVHILAFLDALREEPDIRIYDVTIDRDVEILSGLPNLPDSFRWGYWNGQVPMTDEDSKPISFFQVTDNFMDAFGMGIASGRTFSEDGFHYDNRKPVEAVLGSAYREYIHLHDRFTVSYATETVLEVVGFLEEGAVFPDQSGFIQEVDHGILIPQFTSAGQTAYRDPEQFMMSVLVNASPNVMVLSEDIDAGALLNEYAARYDVFPLTLAPINYANEDQIESITGQQQDLSLVITGLVFLTIVTTLVILISTRIRSDLRVYAIYLLTGRSFRHIFTMLLLENLVLVVLAAIPALYLMGQSYGMGLSGGILEYLLERIWIYVLILLAIVSVIVAAVLNRRNLIAPLRTLR